MEGTPQGTPAPAQGQNAQPADKTPGTSGVEYVSKEDLAALLQRLDGQSRKIGALESELKSAKPAKQASEDLTLREELERIKAETRAEREQALQERKEAAIYSALKGVDVDADTAEVLFDHVYNRYGKSIHVEGRSVYHEDADGTRTDLSKFVAGLLQGAKGDRFRAKPATSSLPRGGNQTGGGKSFLDMTPEERAKLTPEQRQAGWASAAGESGFRA